MNAFSALLQKEFRMTRNSAVLSFALLLIGGLWLVYLSYSRNIGFIIAPAAMILALMLFYPAIYMLKSLAWEWKVTPHLWLHCPQPAWMLLAAKLAAAMLQMLAAIIITAGLLLLGIAINPHPEQLGGANFSTLLPFVLEAGTYSAVFVIAASIHIGAWATLISVSNALAANLMGRFRWLAGVAVFAIAIIGLGQLQQTRVFQAITGWGTINISMRNLPPIPRTTIGMGQIYAGEILFYLILTVVLFAFASWLLDHKVEV